MSVVVFCLATELEAQPLLKDERFDWEKRFSGPFFYRSCLRSGSNLVVTGVGPTAAASAATVACLSFEGRLVNLGVAGSLCDRDQPGDQLEIGRVCSAYEVHPFDRRRDEHVLNKDEDAVLITSGEAIHGGELRAKLGLRAGLVDMELYALAWVAQSAKRDLCSYKVISDMAEDFDASTIVERIPVLMSDLWESVSGKFCY
jgi:nucleoside phosphorylase